MTSKLTWQFQQLPGWAKDVCNAEWVKLIDPPFTNPFPEDKKIKIIGRVYIPDGEVNAMIQRREAGAVEWVNRMLPTIKVRPYVHVWELPNESPVSNLVECQNLAAFTVHATDLLHAQDCLVLGGNLSEANPSGDDDQERGDKFRAIAVGLKACDYWGYHGYWVPDGYPHKESGLNEWHALYYRKLYDYANVQLPPLLLTECGIDGGIVGQRKKGWKTFGSWADYLAQLKAFDVELAKDDNVLAATLFVSGANGDWMDFDIDEGHSRELAAYMTASQEVPVVPPVVVPPVVVPPPVPVKITTSCAPFALARPLANGIGRVSQWWGENPAKYVQYGHIGHAGLDYAVPEGTAVFACHAGTAYQGNDPPGFGKYIKIMGNGHYTVYAHLSDFWIASGTPVEAGDLIGYSGNTGNSTGAHLHIGQKVTGVSNPGYGDWQNPLIGRLIWDKVHEGLRPLDTQ